MKNKTMAITIEDILKEVFHLYENLSENVQKQSREFIATVINGDQIKAYLAINANIKPKIPGILLYVLTNVRLIKIEIEKKGEISSSSFFLDAIISIDRKTVGNDTSSIDIIFQNTSVGLSYSVDDKKITEFFQKIEQIKTEKSSING